MQDITQWEYLAMTIGSLLKPGKDAEIEDKLNEIGEQGWEVVSVYRMENTQKARVIAKRVLTVSARRQRSIAGY